MKFEAIISILEHRYPVSIQEEWDKSGFQCGKRNQEINKIMVALDADKPTIDYAIENHVDLLITHHPFLFKTLTLDFESPTGELIEKIIKNELCIYSLHTPLDKVSMNRWLLQKLELNNIKYKPDSYLAYGYYDQPIDKQTFIENVKKAYALDTVKFVGKNNQIQSIGVVGGSGAEFYQEAIDLKLDAYLTGDTKYHLGEIGMAQDTLLVDIGHHAEVVMAKRLKAYLEKYVEIEVIAYESKDYYQYG